MAQALDNDKTLAEFGPAEYFIISMEYCPVTLSRHIKHSRSMGEIRRILIEVCAGLTAMHRKGIIHTDLDIENIFLKNRGVVKIGDFGVSERWEEGIRDIIRNLDVAAPELSGGEGGDQRSDIYSLGLLSFKLATGKDLIDHNLFNSLTSGNYDFSELNVPRRFVEICIKATHFDPEDRFRMVDDFLEALNKTF